MRMRELGKKSVLLCIVGVVVLLSYEWSVFVQQANAIPAFARKYNFSCNVCHVPGFPKLNDFGNLFRDQGYQLGGDGDLPTHEGIGMGYWPVSIRATVGYQAAQLRTEGSGLSTGGFGFTGLDLLSFGTLHRDIAFGVVYTPALGSAGFGTGASDGDLESAFVRLMRLERYFGVKEEPGRYLMNLRVGKFELDLPFSEKRSPTLNTPFVMYHYTPGTPYTATIGGTSTSSYLNPNTFLLGDNQPGGEISGITKTAATDGYFRYSLTALATNSFSGPLGGCPPNTPCGTGGRNVNFYGHVTQSFGGYGIVTGNRVGLFGAYGQAPTIVNATCPTCQGIAGSGQPFTRIGFDISLTFNNEWNLFGAIMHGHDSSKLFASQDIATAQNASWHGAFVELDYFPAQFFDMPGWFFAYRYDVIRNERQGDANSTSFPGNYNDVDSHTVLMRYFIHQSARTDIALHAEYNGYRTQAVGPNGGDLRGQTMLVGFDFAY